MEFPAVGVIPLEPPLEEHREFMRRKMTHWIRTFEYNVNGKLNRQHMRGEVEKYMETHDHQYKEEEKKQAMEERMELWEFILMCDHPSDTITEEEVVNIWMDRIYSPPEKRKELMTKMNKFDTMFFKQVDLNKNGVVDFSEWYKACKILKDDMIKVMFDAVDADKNGVISLNEWLYSIKFFHFCSGPDDILSQMFGPVPDEIK